MRGLWKITNLLRKDQCKLKAEAIILSRLTYSLQITSTGRKYNTERLQGVQSAAARWVTQNRKRDWRLKKGLKKLGWLSVCQKVAYMSILMAIKILKNERERKIVNEHQFLKMKLTTGKSWSWRSLRWLEKMPDTLQNQDPSKKRLKKRVEEVVRDEIPIRGCRIMW